jgi:hypothetical protein
MAPYNKRMQRRVMDKFVLRVGHRRVAARPGEDRPGADGARVALGQTFAGRHLRVIYVGGARWCIRGHRLRSNGQGPSGIPAPRRKKR